MRVIEAECNAAEDAQLALVRAAIELADDPEHLARICKATWPELTIYYGGTHWRLNIQGLSYGRSIYVDLTRR
jgi:hypothetical protein